MKRRTIVLPALAGVWVLALAVPALADNCGSPADCFGQAGSFNLAALGLLSLAGLSLVLDFVPVVGTGKGVIEAATGRDLLTGQELSWWERGLGVLPVVGGLAAVAGVARAADRIGEVGDTAGQLRRTADTAPDMPTIRDRDLIGSPHAGLRDYTSKEGYATINTFLRDPSQYSDFGRTVVQIRADRVSEGLARLPPAPGTTYRGADLSDDLLARYEPGQVITERAFTSTSRDVHVAQGDFGKNTLMTITGQNGRDVAPFSEWRHEAEILYDKGTSFVVTGKTWDPGLGKWLVTLEEVVL